MEANRIRVLERRKTGGWGGRERERMSLGSARVVIEEIRFCRTMKRWGGA